MCAGQGSLARYQQGRYQQSAQQAALAQAMLAQQMRRWSKPQSDAARLAIADQAREKGELNTACRMYLKAGQQPHPDSRVAPRLKSDSTRFAKIRVSNWTNC